MTVTVGTAIVLRVKMDITVHDVVISVDRTVSDVQTLITVTNVHLDIGEEIVRYVAVGV